MSRCPTCDSKAPHLHPAVQFEGEVEPCIDPYHDADTRQSEWTRGYIAAKRARRAMRDALEQAAWEEPHWTLDRYDREVMRPAITAAIAGDVSHDKLPGLRSVVDRVLDAIENPTGTKRIHTMAGPFGADWDLAGALAFFDAATEVEWVRNLFRHELLVVSGGRSICFDVRRPAVPE